MATVIIKVEKKYPNFIFTTASGREYRAEYHPKSERNRPYFNYYNTRGGFSTEVPAPLRPYKDILDLFSDNWYYMSNEDCLRWDKTIDGISSLPTFDFANFPAQDFRTFMSRWSFPAKKIIKWYSKYGDQIFNDTFFCSTIIAHEEGWTEAEIINIPQNGYGLSQYLANKKWRHFWIKAKSNAAAYFISDAIIASTIDQYLTDCKFLGQKPDTGDFWKNAKIVTEAARQLRTQQEEATFAKTQQFYPLSFEDENFFTIVPLTHQECAIEGAAMHNCVGGIEWDYHLKNGERAIVFVRRKSAPETPYVDWDISIKDLVSHQVYAHHNSEPRDADFQEFAVKFKAYLKSLKEQEGA